MAIQPYDPNDPFAQSYAPPVLTGIGPGWTGYTDPTTGTTTPLDPNTPQGQVVGTPPLPGARDYPGQTAPAPAAAAGNPMDPAYIKAQLDALYGPNWTDKNGTGADYYVQKILSTGGWQGANQNYWTSRIPQEIAGTYPAESAGGSNAINPDYLKPFTVAPPSPTAGNLNYGPPPAFNYQPFQGFTPFDPTSVQQILNNDVGYKFRQEQAQKGLEASAAARGLLNSGGTLADLLNLNQNMASQEADNAFTRAFGTWNQNNQNALQTYNTNRANAADIYNTNYNTQFVDPYQFKAAQQSNLFNQALQSWQGLRDQFYQNENAPFSKIYQLASLGANAAAASPTS